MSKQKGVIKHQSEKLVDKAKEALSPDEPKPQVARPVAVTPKKETVRVGIDNHLIDSYEFDLGDEKFLVNSVYKGGSDIPKSRAEEIEKAANQRGYFLVEVE